MSGFKLKNHEYHSKRKLRYLNHLFKLKHIYTWSLYKRRI